MIDETKLMLEDGDNANLQDEQSMFSFQNLYAMLVLNWQWFLLSLFICICGALIYLRYAKPVYQVSAKMLIKDENNRRSSANQMLANMQDFGFMSNSAGIENASGRMTKQLIYGTQPVSVDIDSVSLSNWDKQLLEGSKSIQLTLERNDGTYQVKGETMFNGKASGSFSKEFNKLPATIHTDYGVLAFTQHGAKAMEDGSKYHVTILPPMSVATGYAKALNVAPTSKQTSIAELTLTDMNKA